MLEKPKYTRIQSYGSMTSSRSDDDMTVHSQLFPYPKKMVVEREILYEEEHPPFQPLFATTRIFGKARFTCLMALYLCFYVFYLIAGAIVFSSLEYPFENDIRVSVFRAKHDFMARNPTVLAKMDNLKYGRVQSYGSMTTSTSEDDMTVHSRLFPYQKKMVVEREILYEEENPPFQPLLVTSRMFGEARSTCLLVPYIFFYVLFLMLGAVVFNMLEDPIDRQTRIEVLQAKADFMARHPEILEGDLEALLDEVIKASNRGVSASKNVTSGPNWSFGQSLFFSSTVVTTIGYGHVTPLSKPGKLFCMVYAVLGIPLTLVLLSALVERLLLPATALLRALNAALGHLYRPFTIRLVHLMIIVTTFVVFFILVPAAIFASLEPEWDFLDSLYYCFISLTTIGLGDYIPGDSPEQPYRPLYKVATTLYLITGLTFLMLTLTVFYDIPQLNLSTVFSSMKLDEDPEKMRLSGSAGPGYGMGGLVMRDHYDQRRSVVHIRPHQDDSPSPEDTTPVHARDIRLQ
ncbi:Potassium channel subfamily K member 1 [Papilio machaon]|uniref:Potassium channel subfamily K member 1 n=1 Tax=Papilio machaon TaxID=76193 RepID=A0A194RJH5_PAPMA|nr:Potassium channel subfamily K member 1 [Papilio machaon]